MSVVAKTKENLYKCQCMKKCPSYTFACKVKAIPQGIADILKKDISKEEHIEAIFCAFGKSKCIIEEKGCVCDSCAVHAENDLNKTYYCMMNGGK